jgi:hypothetical protein
MPRPKIFKYIDTVNRSFAGFGSLAVGNTNPLSIELEPISLRFEIKCAARHRKIELTRLAQFRGILTAKDIADCRFELCKSENRFRESPSVDELSECQQGFGIRNPSREDLIDPCQDRWSIELLSRWRLGGHGSVLLFAINNPPNSSSDGIVITCLTGDQIPMRMKQRLPRRLA